MKYITAFILIIKFVKGGVDNEDKKNLEPKDKGLITKVSNTELNTVQNKNLKDQCKNIRHLIYYDKAFCYENCIKVAEDCKMANDPVLCVAKLKNKSVERNLFFKKCKFTDKFQELVDKKTNDYENKCFLTKSVYRDSWVDPVNRSCHCALINAEPCSEEEVLHSEEVMEELVNSAICPKFDHDKFSIDNKSIFSIAISKGKKIHCPKLWMLLNNSPGTRNLPMKGFELETSGMDDDEISKYCQHGSIYSKYSTQSSRKGWHYNCDDVSAVESKWKNSCQEMCRKVDKNCSKFDSELLDCLKERLKKGDEEKLFTKYNCYFPEDVDKNLGEVEHCELVYRDSEKKQECLALCEFAKGYCEINSNKTKEKCMSTMFDGGDEKGDYMDEEMRSMMETFNKNCKFNRNTLGKGYVFCKIKKRKCEYSDWSKWSRCTNSCIDYDNIPVRYRTRRVVSNTDCMEEKIGTIEFQICSNLPTCRNRQWITANFTESDIIGNFDKIKNTKEERDHKWITIALNMHPEIMSSKYNTGLEDPEEMEDDKKYLIKKAVIVTTFEQTECSCPRGYKEISFATFIKSSNLKQQLEKLCRKDEYNQLVFDSRGRYVFYCNIGLVIKEVEKATCDDPDSKEYVACRKEESHLNKIKQKEIRILIKSIIVMLAGLGVIGMVLMCMYLKGYKIKIKK